MPMAFFSDDDLKQSITMLTNYRPREIIRKFVNEKGEVVVVWK